MTTSEVENEQPMKTVEEFTTTRIYILGIPVMRKSELRTIQPVTETKQTEEEKRRVITAWFPSPNLEETKQTEEEKRA